MSDIQSFTMHVEAEKDCLRQEPRGASFVLTVAAHFYGEDGMIRVEQAIRKARAASIPWANILEACSEPIADLFLGEELEVKFFAAEIETLIPGKTNPSE